MGEEVLEVLPVVSSSVALFPPSVSVGALYVPADFTISGDIVRVCESCVSGYAGAYVCFQYSSSEYIVICSDNIEYSDNVFTVDGFSAFDIVVTAGGAVESFPVSGDLVGMGETPEIQQFSGSYDNFVMHPDSYALYYDTFDTDILISNANHGVIYSSFDGFAKLHDSSAHYGYFLSWAVSLFGVSCLIWSIFKRVK